MLGSMLLLLSSLLSFMLLPMDPLQSPQLLLTHTQLSRPASWVWSKDISKFWKDWAQNSEWPIIHLLIYSLSSKCVDETYSRNAWHVPLPRGHAQTLPASGPPFDILVPPPAPSRHQLLLKIQTFRKSDSFFVDDKKGERDIVELFGNFYFHVFIYVLFSLDM